MAKEDRIQKKHTPPAPSRLMIRVEYVGIIAIACLVIGALVGSSMGGGQKITVDTAQTQAAAMPQTGETAPPSPEMIEHMMGQIDSIKDYSTLVNMGNAAMDKRVTSVAVAAYEKALKMNPSDPNVLTDLGAVYRDQMKESKKAAELFKKAAALDPKHLQSRYNLGLTALYDLHDNATAEKAFNEVISMAPNSEQAHEAQHHLAEMKGKK